MVPLLSQRPASAAPRTRAVLRAVLAAAYLAAGVLHVAVPGPFLSITPGFVPFPKAVILVTGLCEIAGAVGLFLPRWRWWAGVMLALYAVCVYPANVKHAVDYIEHGTGGLSLWYHVPRLLFQPVIVWWALFAGGVIDWPFHRRSSFR
ncbi:putative membrane protein [Sphingomonas sp. BE270]|uniref:DoxX family protein n=1 Tax=unclassified Sphingomonas TaxID=196159 RepID=UPI00053DBB0D|nr:MULTISPECIES: DoxX family protein [unclassified Sphingomonas]MDR6848809.1 putative membrane protein [Sphingomonas sp. BE137]MDR7256093.1 putative membrane protein [Sphingomonas sp. BE270]